jgi:hypothetical protein
LAQADKSDGIVGWSGGGGGVGEGLRWDERELVVAWEGMVVADRYDGWEDREEYAGHRAMNL